MAFPSLRRFLFLFSCVPTQIIETKVPTHRTFGRHNPKITTNAHTLQLIVKMNPRDSCRVQYMDAFFRRTWSILHNDTLSPHAAHANLNRIQTAAGALTVIFQHTTPVRLRAALPHTKNTHVMSNAVCPALAQTFWTES